MSRDVSVLWPNGASRATPPPLQAIVSEGAIENRYDVPREARDDADTTEGECHDEDTALCDRGHHVVAVAAPTFARGHFRGEYGNGYVMRHRVPRAVDLDAESYHGYVPNNWASYCNQRPKAC